MGISWVQILVIAVLVLLLFGRGRISSLMGDIGAGITSFRKGMREGQAALDEDASDVVQGKTIEGEAAAAPVETAAAAKKTSASENEKS